MTLLVPEELQRNAPDIAAAGYEHTGARLIELAAERLGVTDFAATDVLDIGCGVRFTQTILNRRIAIASYAGVDVDPDVIAFLTAEVADPRFRFARWNVRNQLYNPAGRPLSPRSRLPISGKFDAIWMFSVVTHLTPADTLALLTIARRHVRPSGGLLFSAFADERIERFEDHCLDRPLLRALYNPRYLGRLIEQSGWSIASVHPADEYIQEHFVCRPARRRSAPPARTARGGGRRGGAVNENRTLRIA